MFKITWDKRGGDLDAKHNGILTLIFWRWMLLIELPKFMFTESIVWDESTGEWIPYSEYKSLKAKRGNGR